VILSGPSGSGKTPLAKALALFFPELSEPLRPVVLYNSRAPRPGERDGVDYHFRTRSQIEALGDEERFVVMEVRGDLQALDVEDLIGLLNGGDAFFEGNPEVGRTLQTHASLADVNRLSLFLSPLAREEIYDLRDKPTIILAELVTDIMRRKLLRRTRRQKSELSLKDLENIEVRAGSAYPELKLAWHFDHVIPNHDGEDSEHWEAFYYPLGDARKALLAVAALLRGEIPAGVENWERDLLP
jgi:guanylate kinase